MRTVRVFVIGVAIVASSALVSARQTTNSGGWVPKLQVRIVASSGAGSRSETSKSFALVAGGGDPIDGVFFSGPTLCSLGGGKQEPETPSVISAIPGDPRRVALMSIFPSLRRQNIWKLTGEFLGEEAGRYSIRVSSQFTKENGRDVAGPPIEQTLSLRDGDSVMLDFMRGAVTPNCNVHAVGIEARIIMEPANPALTQGRYSADLWLVHTNERGEEQRRHVTLPLDSGGGVPFRLDALTFPLPQLDPQQADMEAFLQLTGVVRLRPRDNGQLDVDVDTTRGTGLRYPTTSRLNVKGPNGRKTLTLREDETVAIDLPSPNGYMSLAFPGQTISGTISGGGGGGGARGGGGGGATAGGVGAGGIQTAKALDVRDGKMMTMRPELFFKGHKTQLILRVRRAA